MPLQHTPKTGPLAGQTFPSYYQYRQARDVAQGRPGVYERRQARAVERGFKSHYQERGARQAVRQEFKRQAGRGYADMAVFPRPGTAAHDRLLEARAQILENGKLAPKLKGQLIADYPQVAQWGAIMRALYG